LIKAYKISFFIGILFRNRTYIIQEPSAAAPRKSAPEKKVDAGAIHPAACADCRLIYSCPCPARTLQGILLAVAWEEEAEKAKEARTREDRFQFTIL